jgi:TetR/AcrR family transcriptional regulator
MSIKELKEREKEQRREYIIDAAEKQFFSKGYDNVSMNEIADAVEMNKATLYLYFKNKEALYFAVVLRGARLMNEMFRQAAETQPAGIGKVGAMGQAFFEYNRKYADYYRLFRFAMSGRFDMAQHEDGLEFHRLMHDLLARMCRGIKAGMEDGTIRGDMDPLTIAVFLVTTSENAANLNRGMQEGLDSRGISQEQYMRDLMRLLGNAIENPATRPITGQMKND